MSFMQNVMMKMGQKDERPRTNVTPPETISDQDIMSDWSANHGTVLSPDHEHTINITALNNEAKKISERTGAPIDQAKKYLINSIGNYDYEDIDMLSGGLLKKEREHNDAMAAFRAKNQLDFDTKNRKQLLKDLGYTGAGAGLGGLGGYYLAKLIDDSATAKAIGTVLGTGLGGSLGYLYGDSAKNKLVQGYNNLMA